VRDLVAEGVLSEREAVGRIDPAQLDQLMHPAIDPEAPRQLLARGLNASPGAAVGAIVLDADSAERRGRAGEAVVLVRWETTPDDIHGVLAAQGVVTAHGGMTSHAAVVARGMGKPCVAGVEALTVDVPGRSVTVAGRRLAEGEVITLDGATGEVFLARCRSSPRRSTTTSGWWSAGPTASVRSVCGRTPTRRTTRPGPARSARPASASAARSTCSWTRPVCRSSGR
jgi:pyruvate,orthophosphate dikinase